MSTQELSEQEIQRRDSLQKLREMGINPYPAELYPVSDFANELTRNFSEGKEICIAGRIMSRRIMGKASFAEIQDSTGRIQAYFNRDEICTGEDKNHYNIVFKKLLDIGDFVGIKGTMFKTQVGEVSVHVKTFMVLSKSLKPLPLPKTDADGVVHDSFSDPETRYRQRYVDLVVNPHVKDTFIKRSKIISSMRSFLNSKDYLEVETPILQSIPGGAAARPFITHHNALDVPLYLRIANELYLKRLIVGGFDGVYEFAKDFRNEGMDRTHNPEFTMLELYVAYKDYNWMMVFIERLFQEIAQEVFGSTKTSYNQKTINFKGPYKRIPFFDAIKKETGDDISKMTEKELLVYCKSKKIETHKSMGRGKLFDAVFSTFCEEKLIQPTYITDYPIEMSPLTKKHRETEGLTERFELFINGKEIANAYSEQNNPIEQRKSFEEQVKLAERGDDEAMLIDNRFLSAMEYGMPPTSGIGIGMDRLTMLFTNKTSIQDVLFFPQMKPERK